jgi:hypothetical protein
MLSVDPVSPSAGSRTSHDLANHWIGNKEEDTLKQLQGLPKRVFARATLDITIEQLEAHGIQMSEPVENGTWDEAGPIEEAFVQLESGQAVLLIAHVKAPHVAAPEIGIEVRAPDGVDCQGIAEAIAAELAISHDQITWVRPSGWPFPAPGGGET